MRFIFVSLEVGLQSSLSDDLWCRKAFHLVDQCSFDPNRRCLVGLPRNVATELVLLAVLAPLALSDLGAEYLDRIFCADASLEKGAVCSAPLSKRLNQAVWRSCRSKGSYSRLLRCAEVILKRAGMLEEERLAQRRGDVKASRPIAFIYDFLEIFAGAAVVTEAVASHGLIVGPPIDLSISEEHNLALIHVVEWLSSIIADGRLKAFHLSPPCTTFSIMRRPRLRSPTCPFGFDVDDPQTKLGTLLSCRSLQLLYIGVVNGAAGIMEIPHSAYAKHLPQWKAIQQLPDASFVRSDSCMFGSPRQKSFGFLCINIDDNFLSRRCDRSHQHVKVQGTLGKGICDLCPRLGCRTWALLQRGHP